MHADIAGIVLAGGKSSRLGIDKTALRAGGKTLLERTVDVLWHICSGVVVVTNSPEMHSHLKAILVGDVYPGKGVLGGIYSGLQAAPEQYSIVVAADMPFLNAELLCYLASLCPGFDVVVPLVGGQAEPLHAVYGRSCLEPIRRRLLQAEPARIISFFDEVSVRYVSTAELSGTDPDLLSFFNINTPDDLAEARRLLARRGIDLA